MRTALIIILVLASWLAMQAVHESGHVLAALATGGSVENVILLPWQFSRTDLSSNPRPLAVVWAGPVLGVIAPLLLWGAATLARLRQRFLLRFFAGFCFVANGAYIGAGSFDHVGDCGDMLRLGAPIWTLWAFGAATIAAGFALWHGQARHFGFGPDAEPVQARDVGAVSVVLLAILALDLWVGG